MLKNEIMCPWHDCHDALNRTLEMPMQPLSVLIGLSELNFYQVACSFIKMQAQIKK